MSSILFIGNFGYGNEGQKQVSLLMEKLIKKNNVKFIIGLGNNIMPNGIKGKNDEQFLKKFEEPYMNLPKNIKFFNILGKGDYTSKTSPHYQINYNHISYRWILPHNFYCFRKKFNNIPVEFICIDTNLSKMKTKKTQEKWILNTIYESKCRWIIVCGHHSWKNYSNEINQSDDNQNELNELYEKIAATKKVDLLLSGSETNKQHIHIPNKPNMFICGVGAVKNEYIKFYNNEELKFHSKTLGCGMINFNKNRMNIYFYNVKGEKEYSFIINKI